MHYSINIDQIALAKLAKSNGITPLCGLRKTRKTLKNVLKQKQKGANYHRIKMFPIISSRKGNTENYYIPGG